MSTLGFTAGVGVSSSGACGLPLVLNRFGVRASRYPVHPGRGPDPLFLTLS